MRTSHKKNLNFYDFNSIKNDISTNQQHFINNQLNLDYHYSRKNKQKKKQLIKVKKKLLSRIEDRLNPKKNKNLKALFPQQSVLLNKYKILLSLQPTTYINIPVTSLSDEETFNLNKTKNEIIVLHNSYIVIKERDAKEDFKVSKNSIITNQNEFITAHELFLEKLTNQENPKNYTNSKNNYKAEDKSFNMDVKGLAKKKKNIEKGLKKLISRKNLSVADSLTASEIIKKMNKSTKFYMETTIAETNIVKKKFLMNDFKSALQNHKNNIKTKGSFWERFCYKLNPSHWF